MTSPLKVHGADGSHWNDEPDLEKAKKAGLLWLYNKVTDGETFVDPSYARRRKAAAEAGLPFGGYHYSRPDISVSDAEEEARYFMKNLRPKAGDLVPALDFEESFKYGKVWATKFMAEIERLLTIQRLLGKPLHYGPNDFGKDYKYNRWVGRYNNTNTPPTVPFDIHQFSNGEYGVPHSFPGLPGRWDLNHMRDGFGMQSMRLTGFKPPAEVELRGMHCSMQFSLSEAKTRADVNEIFARAQKAGVVWVSGTEAGDSKHPVRPALKELAPKYGFRVDFGKTDGWVAVREERITKGSYTQDEIVVLSPQDGVEGKHGWKGVKWASWIDTELKQRITVGATHYLRYGRPDAKDPDYKVNIEFNKKLAAAVAQFGRDHSEGRDICFMGLDANIPDPKESFFFGIAPFTTAADELDHHVNTGHGEIDGIASYDRDVRVYAKSWRAWDDKQWSIFGDHYPTEALFGVRLGLLD